MAKTLLEKVESAQRMIDEQALAFGKIVIDNLDKKDFKNTSEFKKWYLNQIAKTDDKTTPISENVNPF